MSDDLKARIEELERKREQDAWAMQAFLQLLHEHDIKPGSRDLIEAAERWKQELERERDEARARAERLAKALKPFANPPLYVFDQLDDKLWIPHTPPDGWVGGGAVNTLEYRRARAALNKEPSDG